MDNKITDFIMVSKEEYASLINSRYVVETISDILDQDFKYDSDYAPYIRAILGKNIKKDEG